MAAGRRSRKGAAGRGLLGGPLGNLVTWVVVAAVALAGARVNGIRGLEDVYRFGRSWSDYIFSCNDGGRFAWFCERPGAGLGGSRSADGTSSGPGATAGGSQAQDSGSGSLAALEALTVAQAQDVDYDRTQWKHWVTVEGACNTRETVLVQQGSDVQVDDRTCRPLSGTWVDLYSGATLTDPKGIDIDHVIPLGYVAAHGGQGWDPARKQQYANDLDVLLAVSAKENRSKSDKGPEAYMPPDATYHCEYARKWVDVASRYQISVTEGDKKVLAQALGTC